jgi:hypothetical protein
MAGTATQADLGLTLAWPPQADLGVTTARYAAPPEGDAADDAVRLAHLSQRERGELSIPAKAAGAPGLTVAPGRERRRGPQASDPGTSPVPPRGPLFE